MKQTKEQEECKYCHTPFVDFSGKDIPDFGDGVYCDMDDEGNLEWGASYDSGCLGDQEDVVVNYCPFCGRKLGDK